MIAIVKPQNKLEAESIYIFREAFHKIKLDMLWSFGQDERDSRWAHVMNLYGEKKNECGLHLDKHMTSEWSV